MHDNLLSGGGPVPEDCRRALIVAVDFPPFKSVGRLRIVKLCQHLPQFGWKPLVLTINDTASVHYDPATLDEIPSGTSVYRALLPEPEEAMIRAAKRVLGRKDQVRSAGADQPPGEAKGSEADGELEATLKRIKASFDRVLVQNVLIPDDVILWTLPAVMLGKRICRTQNVDVLFATAPPFTDLLVGRLLKMATGLPLVADYRDLWTGDVLREWVPLWRRRIEIGLERWAVSKADAVIAVSEPKTEFLKQRLSQVRSDRFFTVTNGYDPEEYEGIERAAREVGYVRFVYTGRLYKNRRGYELIEAAGSLFRARPDLKPKFRMEYYGAITPEIQARLDELVAEFDLAEAIRFYPDVSSARAKQLQVDADVLLVVVDTGETASGMIPAKLFEYIVARRPVLCIAAPGATSTIIQQGRLGWVTSPGDVTALRNVLRDILSTNVLSSFDPDFTHLSQFERKGLVNRIAQILDRVSAQDKRHV